MKTALIITGGEFSPPYFLTEYDYVIACDKGYEYAQRLGIKPDIIIGDFDSIKKPVTDIKTVTHPIEKDDTDTMLAIKHALNEGYDHIILICALGGRTDHALSNIQSMHYVASHGALCEAFTKSEHLQAVKGPFSLDVMSTDYFSLFSLTDCCSGVTIKNAKYEAVNITLNSDFPLGHGNSIKKGKENAQITFDSGVMLIVSTKTDS